MIRRSLVTGLGLFLLVVAAPSQGWGQTTGEEDAVVAVAERFLEGISTGDRGLLESTTYEGMILVSRRSDGALRTTTRDEFLTGVVEDKGRFLERMWDPSVLVDGPTAAVVTPYDFWIEGRFSHCGSDTFLFLKTDAGWKITSVAYDVRPPAECAPSPLGPPGS